MMSDEPAQTGLATPEFGSGVSDNEQDDLIQTSNSLYVDSDASDDFEPAQSIEGLVRKYAQNNRDKKTLAAVNKKVSENSKEAEPVKSKDSSSEEKTASDSAHTTPSTTADSAPSQAKKKLEKEVTTTDSSQLPSPGKAPPIASPKNRHEKGERLTQQSKETVELQPTDIQKKKADQSSFIQTLLFTKNSLKPQGSFRKRPESDSPRQDSSTSQPMRAEIATDAESISNSTLVEPDKIEEIHVEVPRQTVSSATHKTSLSQQDKSDNENIPSGNVPSSATTTHSIVSTTPLATNDKTPIVPSSSEDPQEVPSRPFWNLIKKDVDTPISAPQAVTEKVQYLPGCVNPMMSQENLKSDDESKLPSNLQRKSSVSKSSTKKANDSESNQFTPDFASSRPTKHRMPSTPIVVSQTNKASQLSENFELKKNTTAKTLKKPLANSSPIGATSLTKFPLEAKFPTVKNSSSLEFKQANLLSNSEVQLPTINVASVPTAQVDIKHDDNTASRKTRITDPQVQTDLLNQAIPTLPERVLFKDAVYLPVEKEVLETFKRIVCLPNLPSDEVLLKIIWYHQEGTYADALLHYTELSGWLSQNHASASQAYQNNASSGSVYCYGRSLWGHPVIVCRVANFLKVKQSEHILTTVHLLDVVKVRLLSPGTTEQVVFLMDMKDCSLLEQTLVVYLRGISRLFCGLVAAWFFINCDVATYISFVDYEIVENSLRSKFHFLNSNTIGNYVWLDQLETLYGGFAANATQFDCLYSTLSESPQGQNRYRTIQPIGPTILSEPFVPVCLPTKTIPLLSLSDLKTIHRSIQQIVHLLQEKKLYHSSFYRYVTKRTIFGSSCFRDTPSTVSSAGSNSSVGDSPRVQLLPSELALLSRMQQILFDRNNAVFQSKLEQMLRTFKPSDLKILLLRSFYSTQGDIFAITRYLMDHLTVMRRDRCTEGWTNECPVRVVGKSHWNHPVLLLNLKMCVSFIVARSDRSMASRVAQNVLMQYLDEIKTQHFIPGVLEQWYFMVNFDETACVNYQEDQIYYNDLLNFVETIYPAHTACLILRQNHCQYIPPARFELQYVNLTNDTELKTWIADIPLLKQMISEETRVETNCALTSNASATQNSQKSQKSPKPHKPQTAQKSTIAASDQSAKTQNLASLKLNTNLKTYMPPVWYHAPLPYRQRPVEFLLQILQNITSCNLKYLGNAPPCPVSSSPPKTLQELEVLLSPSTFIKVHNCLFPDTIPLVLLPCLQQKCANMNLNQNAMISNNVLTSPQTEQLFVPSPNIQTSSGIQIVGPKNANRRLRYVQQNPNSLNTTHPAQKSSYKAAGSVDQRDSIVSTMHSLSSFEHDQFYLRQHHATPCVMSSALPESALRYSSKPQFSAMQAYRNSGFSNFVVSNTPSCQSNVNPTDKCSYLVTTMNPQHSHSYINAANSSLTYPHNSNIRAPRATSMTNKHPYTGLNLCTRKQLLNQKGELLVIRENSIPDPMTNQMAGNPSHTKEKQKFFSRPQNLRTASSLTDQTSSPCPAFSGNARLSGSSSLENQNLSAVSQTTVNHNIKPELDHQDSSTKSDTIENNSNSYPEQDLLNEVIITLRKTTAKHLLCEISEEIVLPFLQVSTWNTAKCVKLFTDHLAWKDSFAKNLCKEELKDSIADPSLLYLCGHDRHLRPVLISRLQALNLTDHEIAQKYLIYTMTVLLKEMRRYDRTDPINFIVDVEGFSSWGVLSAGCAALIKVLQDNFPTKLNRCFVINSNNAFKLFWTISISNQLTLLTRSKISLLDKNFLKSITKTISKSQLEMRYGGKLPDTQFTPYKLPPIQVCFSR